MPYTLEQFLEESKQDVLNSLTLEEKLKLAQEIPLEQYLKYLDTEQLKHLMQVIQEQLNNSP